MASFDKLSDETLLLIFTLNSKHLYFKPIHNTSKTTLATSHVCKRWRDTTLKHPILWSNSFDISVPFPLLINVINPRIRDHRIDALMIPSVTPVLIQYLKPEREIEVDSLSVICTINTLFRYDIKLNQFSRRLLYILKLLPATDKIFLKIPSHGWLLLEMFFESSISHLDTFVLHRDKVDIYSDPSTSKVYTLSQALAKATSLWKMRTLWLRGCNVYLKSAALAGVENLVLSETPISVAFTPNQLLDVLKAMPKLQRVVLVETVISNPAGQNFKPVGKLIDLPQLVEFIISGLVGPVGEVVTSLAFPTGCARSIQGKGVVSHQGNNSAIGHMLHQIRVAFKKQTPSPTRWDAFALQMHPCKCLLRTWKLGLPFNGYPLVADTTSNWFGTIPGGFELALLWNPALLNPIFLGAQPRIDSSTLLRQLSTYLPKSCKGIKILELDYDLSALILPAAHESLMFGFLSHFPKVQVLNIVNLNTAEFLMPYFKFRYDGGTVQDPLKDLDTLCFYCVDFTKVYSWPVAQVPHPAVQLRQILLDYVERRVKNRALEPIEKIIFRRCTGFTPADTMVLVSFGVTPIFSNDLK